eukprot:COSAG02_NODE_565_length_20246_cov_13.930163_13_plen_72_part_00
MHVPRLEKVARGEKRPADGDDGAPTASAQGLGGGVCVRVAAYFLAHVSTGSVAYSVYTPYGVAIVMPSGTT